MYNFSLFVDAVLMSIICDLIISSEENAGCQEKR